MNSEVVDVVDNNDTEDVYTLDEALAVVGFGKFQALVLAYAGLGSMSEAMEMMILSFIGPTVKAEWGLSSGQESLISTMVFAGMLVGAYSWGTISDKYGRRMGLLSIAVLTSIFAILSAFSPNYISLILCRMMVGVGLGGGPVYFSWCLEFVPARNRGFWMVVFSTFWSVGAIVEASLAWIFMPRLGWRWLLALSSVPCIAALLLYFYTVESPRYLYLNGRITDTDNLIKKMAAVNKTHLPSGMLVSDQRSELDEEFTPEDTLLLSTRKNKVAIGIPGFSLLTLLSSSLVKTTLLMWALYFGTIFAYYGVVLLTSQLSSAQRICGNIILNSNQSTDTGLYRDTFITTLAEFPGLVLSAILVDKVGRRISMLLMFSFCAICLLPLMFHQDEVITTSLLFGARLCISGCFTLAYIYCPEVYPTSVRITGAGAASAVGRIAGMICPLVAVELVSGCQLVTAISLFEVVIVLSVISVLLLPIETKGRELNDVVAVK